MKQLFTSLFIYFLFQVTGAQQVSDSGIINDTIEIRGKYADSCYKSPYVFITKYENPSGDLGRVTVDEKGEFVNRMFVEEAGEIVFREGAVMNDFIVTDKQKVYELELTCPVRKSEKEMGIVNSPENDAYKAFYAIRKKLKADLDTFKTQDIATPKVYKEFKQLWRDFEKNIASKAKQYPGTFTTDHLIAADMLSEQDLSSVTALREKFLQRESFSDPLFYNTFLAPRMLSNYMDFIRDKTDTSFLPFEKLLDIASKNTTAAKRLQYMLYDLFYRRREEALLNGYIRWFKAHPEKMVQLVIRSRLERLSRCMAGSDFINIQLKDTGNITRKLNETVSASKLTLLIFYSPTCSHCKEEIPKMVPLWEKYKDKGLGVFTVASDAKETEWHSFIRQHTGSGWQNVMEDGNNYYNSIYVISSTPMFILIDSRGKIISRMGVPDYLISEIPKRLDL